jgi:hypothetical protein
MAAGGRSSAADRTVAGGPGAVGPRTVAGAAQSAAAPGGGGETARRQPQSHDCAAPLAPWPLGPQCSPHQGRVRVSTLNAQRRQPLAAHVSAHHGGAAACAQGGFRLHPQLGLHRRLRQVRFVWRDAGQGGCRGFW